MNIYGHFYILSQKVHYVTFIGMLVLGTVYLYRQRNLKAPLLMKLLLPCLYVFGALMHYEIMWNSIWMFYWPVAALDFVGFALCEVLIIYSIGRMKSTYNYNVPRIGLNRWVIVTMGLGIMMVWLYSTVFYTNYKLLYTGLSTIDPHNFAWAVGKLFGLLSWMFITNN